MSANYTESRERERDNVPLIALEDKKWRAVAIQSLFPVISPGRISNASSFARAEHHGLEYIAATNRNNGCLYFLQDNEKSRAELQAGNCIGFIKDGDGSAGYAIYKRERFTSTVNVLYGYADWVNRFTGLFFVASQDLIKPKYGHGYKRNEAHLNADKVMLPVNDSDEPDFEYMEQYGRKMITDKYHQYLAYLKG